jgi:hypothetical protein
MKNTTKKIIAREFLFFVLTLVIGLIGFFATFLYNWSTRKKIKEIIAPKFEMCDRRDSLAAAFNNKDEKQKLFYYRYIEITKPDSQYSSHSAFWQQLSAVAKKDSTKLKWKKRWDTDLVDLNKVFGFKSPDDFIKFIQDNTISNSEEQDYRQSKKLIEDIKDLDYAVNYYEQKIFYSKLQIEVGLRTFLAAFILLFIIRHFINALIWSFKAMKQKDSN